MTLFEQLRILIAVHEEERHQERLLAAIGAARTDAEFAVAWCRWYYDGDLA